MEVFAFYMFAVILVGAAIAVVSAPNPVHAVLFLILAFFNSAGLFLLMGAEFLAMVMVIVYVGAVAVLFLFVVMMLDVNFAELRQKLSTYLPLGAAAGAVMLAEIAFVLIEWPFGEAPAVVAEPVPAATTNTHALGGVLYTDFALPFQVAGLILLVAMIGAIVLTHRRRAGVRRQSIEAQIDRRPSDSIQVVKVTPRKGV